MWDSSKLDTTIDNHKNVNGIMDARNFNVDIKQVFREYEIAIAYFEEVFKIKPDEKNSLLTLMEFYFKVRDQKPEYLNELRLS